MRAQRSDLRSSSLAGQRANTLSANGRLKPFRNNHSTEKRLPGSQDESPSVLRTQKNFVIRKVESNVDREKQLADIKEVDYGDPTKRYYHLGKGNNHQLIKRILDRRRIWVEGPELPLVHFKWTQTTYGTKFYKLNKSTMCFNHFEFHRQISNKQFLVRNLVNFCQANKLNAFDITPTTFIIDLSDDLLQLNLNAFVKFFNYNMPQRLRPPTLQPKTFIQLPKLPAPIARHQKRCQGNFYCHPSISPTFFSLSSNYLWLLKPTFLNRGRGIHLFKDLYELERLVNDYAAGNWEGLNKREEGGGEEVGQVPQEESQEEKENSAEVGEAEGKLTPMKVDKMEDSKVMEQKTPHSKSTGKPSQSPTKPQTQPSQKPTTATHAQSAQKPPAQSNPRPNFVRIRASSFVLQKYIQRPLLINNRKFDVRVWALVTHTLQLYFFKQGYIRTSCQEYNPQDLDNVYIHLTNNAIQKYSDKYEKYEFGNQLSFDQFDQMLQGQGYVKFREHIVRKIKESIFLSMCAVKRKLNEKSRRYCFEVFGYDFLIDERMKTWLIEVNTNPCIEESSPLLGQLIPRMLDDAFKLTLDKIFPHNQQLPPMHVDKYPDDENMWQLLGDLADANRNTLKKRFTFVRR